MNGSYEPITPDERGWLWSEQLQLYLGAWRGLYLGEEHTWPRFYWPDGTLVLLPDEAATQRADTEQQRADALAMQLALLQEELRRLRGEA